MMNIVLLSGSIVGSKTRTALQYVQTEVQKQTPEATVTFLDLADYTLPFSDGRSYVDYEGDAAHVTRTLMAADAIIIGTPIFQASIPATLKNIFDLLPMQALRGKVVSLVVTAGTAKHFLVAEQQIKPILSYMKAHIVPTYVFIEEKDFYRQQMMNDDVLLRIERLVEDTVLLVSAQQHMAAQQTLIKR